MPDRNVGAYVASADGAIYAFVDGRLSKIAVCPRLKTIAGVDGSSLYALDSAGILYEFRNQQMGSGWSQREIQTCALSKSMNRFIGAFTDDSLLVRGINDVLSIYTISNDSLHPMFDMRSIPGFKPLSTLQRVGSISAIADNKGVVLYDMRVGFDICQMYPVAPAMYTYANKTWTTYARDQITDGRLTSAERVGDTLVYGTTNGSITRVDRSTYQPVIRRPMRGDLVRWLGSSRDNDTIVFYIETVTCDTNNPAGILFAIWDAKRREWGGVYEVIASPTWPFGDGYGNPRCHISIKHDRIVFSRHNAIMLLELSTGKVLRETRIKTAITGLRYMEDHSIVAAGISDRIILDSSLIVRDQSVFVDVMRFVSNSVIDRDGNILGEGAQNSFAVYHSAANRTTHLLNDQNYSLVGFTFGGSDTAFLVAGEVDGRVDVRMMSRRDCTILASFTAANPSPNLVSQLGWLSDGPDYVRPFREQPSLFIVRAKQRDVRFIPPPSGWASPTTTRDRFTSGGLQHQLNDSTYMIIYSNAEMWVYTDHAVPTSVTAEGQQVNHRNNVEIYPNPAGESFTVRSNLISASQEGPVFIELVDVHGQIILQQHGIPGTSDRSGSVEVYARVITPGPYYLRVSHGNRHTSATLVLVR